MKVSREQTFPVMMIWMSLLLHSTSHTHLPKDMKCLKIHINNFPMLIQTMPITVINMEDKVSNYKNWTLFIIRDQFSLLSLRFRIWNNLSKGKYWLSPVPSSALPTKLQLLSTATDQ